MSNLEFTDTWSIVKEKDRSWVRCCFGTQFPIASIDMCYTTPKGCTIAPRILATAELGIGTLKPCSTSLVRSRCTVSIRSAADLWFPHCNMACSSLSLTPSGRSDQKE